MFPWLWLWAPQYRFPLSGSVAQDLSPDLGLFFNAMPEDAGIAAIERKLFEQSSYGSQLDSLHKAVRELGGIVSPKAGPELGALYKLQDELQKTKEKLKQEHADSARSAMERLRKHDAKAFQSLMAELGWQA